MKWIMYKITAKDWSIMTDSSRDVYNYLVENVFKVDTKTISEEIHNICADAEGWCELASVGEVYEHDKFEIEVIDI